MNTKIILLNGPPRSGKDTAALSLLSSLNARKWRTRPQIVHEKFSAPLKEAFAGMLRRKINKKFEVDFYEANKELMIPTLGCSFRQWQIDFSEKFMKPLYGEDIFARLFVRRLRTDGGGPSTPKLVIVSDCGFQIEHDTVRNSIYPELEFITLGLYRPGCDFSKDSREYIRGDVIPIMNDKTLGTFRAHIFKAVEPFIRNWEHL